MIERGVDLPTRFDELDRPLQRRAMPIRQKREVRQRHLRLGGRDIDHHVPGGDVRSFPATWPGEVIDWDSEQRTHVLEDHGIGRWRPMGL
jgi:hypothetical protein